MANCTRGCGPDDLLYAACPDCGHINVMHPGANPSLKECLICTLLNQPVRYHYHPNPYAGPMYPSSP